MDEDGKFECECCHKEKDDSELFGVVYRNKETPTGGELWCKECAAIHDGHASPSGQWIVKM